MAVLVRPGCGAGYMYDNIRRARRSCGATRLVIVIRKGAMSAARQAGKAKKMPPHNMGDNTLMPRKSKFFFTNISTTNF